MDFEFRNQLAAELTFRALQDCTVTNKSFASRGQVASSIPFPLKALTQRSVEFSEESAFCRTVRANHTEKLHLGWIVEASSAYHRKTETEHATRVMLRTAQFGDKTRPDDHACFGELVAFASPKGNSIHQICL